MLVYFIATGGVSVLRKAIGFMVLLVWLAQGTVAAQGASEANVALGKSYTVVMRYDNEGSRKDERNYPDSGGELTDGKLAPTSFWNPAWVGFAQGFERRITVDLEEVHTVSRIWANFLKQSDAGIHLPRFVLFEASADGTHWERLGRVNYPGEAAVASGQTFPYELADLNIAARYVRLTVPVAVWVFMDEVEIYGTRGVAANARLAQGEADPEPRAPGYMKAGTPEVGGAHHIILLPAGGRAGQPGDQLWRVEDYLPYVAYLDANGTPLDWMFDTVLISPPKYAESGREYASRASVWSVGNMLDWQIFHDTLFRPNMQLDALNKAVARAKEALGDSDYKLKVILATVYPTPAGRYFGDVDGDGVSENLDYTRGEEALADARKVADWFFHMLLSSWEQAAFEHLELIGVYWQMEDVGMATSAFEEAMIRYTSDLAHAHGLKLFWIPYIRAGLYYDWERLGIDGVMMQPNHMFSTLTNLLQTNAELTYAAGMGVEMEADAFKGPEKDRKWIEYLNAGVEYGYMEGTLIGWYQHFKDFARASRMEGRNRQLYYDYVYQFIQGTYTVQPVE